MIICQQCGKIIPPNVRKTAKYCSGNCRNKASYLRNVHAHTANEAQSSARGQNFIEQLQREAITASHLRDLKPVTERYKPIARSPFLGAEFQIPQ